MVVFVFTSLMTRDTERVFMYLLAICTSVLVKYLFMSFTNWIVFLFLSFLFKATPEAYGGSQARGQIESVAAALHHSHSNARSKLRLRPTPQLMARLDP